jgi:N-acetylmuramic acid 6-phosphate etherase
MVHVQLINDKILDRGVRMLMGRSGMTDYEEARRLLLEYGSVRKALDHLDHPVN